MEPAIRSYFSHFTKDELFTILSFFEQKYSRKVKKAELVAMVSEFIGGHPGEWLYRLPERDLRFLRLIVNAGPENWIKMESPEYPSVASLLGLIYVDDNSFDDIMATLDHSLYFPIASIIDQVIREKENDGSFEIERTALGILNIYGAIPVEEFIEKVFDMYEGEDSGRDATIAMADCPIITMNRAFYKDNFYIVSPYAYDYESIIDGREEFEEIKDFPTYSKETAAQAGAGSPFCAFKTPEYDSLKYVLEEMGYEDEEVRSTIHDIWLNSQYAANESSAEAIFSAVNSKIDEIESFDKYRKYIDIVAAYANSVPKWLLKGHVSSDVGLLQMSIKVDESMLESPFGTDEEPQEEYQGPLKEYYIYNMAVHHVAPDDPCPCGSGLSYCRCHGKRLN